MDPQQLEEIITLIGHWIGFLGVIIIVAGIVYGGVMAGKDLAARGLTSDQVYGRLRQRIGRGLVLGLEVLVAADIVETVAIKPTFTNIGVLALIVAVRTFLGWSLEVELDGRWPWNKKKDRPAAASGQGNPEQEGTKPDQSET